LERSSKKECLFSVTGINVSEFSFKSKYKTNEDDKHFEVSKENLKVQAVGDLVYFLVMGDFLTGYHYDFEIYMTSLSDGDVVVCFGYQNHSVRGKFCTRLTVNNFAGFFFSNFSIFEILRELIFVDQNFCKILKRKKHELWLIFDLISLIFSTFPSHTIF